MKPLKRQIKKVTESRKKFAIAEGKRAFLLPNITPFEKAVICAVAQQDLLIKFSGIEPEDKLTRLEAIAAEKGEIVLTKAMKHAAVLFSGPYKRPWPKSRVVEKYYPIFQEEFVLSHMKRNSNLEVGGEKIRKGSVWYWSDGELLKGDAEKIWGERKVFQGLKQAVQAYSTQNFVGGQNVATFTGDEKIFSVVIKTPIEWKHPYYLLENGLLCKHEELVPLSNSLSNRETKNILGVAYRMYYRKPAPENIPEDKGIEVLDFWKAFFATEQERRRRECFGE